MTNPISYDLRKDDEVFLNPARSVRYGINLLLFQGSLLWNTAWYKDNNFLRQIQFFKSHWRRVSNK